MLNAEAKRSSPHQLKRCLEHQAFCNETHADKKLSVKSLPMTYACDWAEVAQHLHQRYVNANRWQEGRLELRNRSARARSDRAPVLEVEQKQKERILVRKAFRTVLKKLH